MKAWLVRLTGEQLDLSDLARLLRSPELNVTEEDGTYYLRSTDFNSLAGLDLADWTPDPPALRIRHGKGDKERIVPLVGGAADAVREWVRRRGDAPGALFLPITKAGKVCGEGLSDQAIYNVLRKRLALREVREQARPLGSAHRVQGSAEQTHVPARGLQEPEEGSQQRTLPRPVRPEDHAEFPAPKRGRHPAQNERAPGGDVQVANFEH